MKRQEPIAWLPLNSLRAFAVVHQTGSVGAAAKALNVTHGAISQHLRGLEARLQRKLFMRSGNRLVMLPEAKVLAESLHRNFRAVANDIDEFRQDENILNITVTPHFAQSWLLPRLGDFLRRHPQIDLRINADKTVHDLVHSNFDAAVRYGDGPWPGLNCKKLFESRDVIVAAPSIFKAASVQTPQDLAGLPWILDEDRDAEMLAWFDQHGVDQASSMRTTRLPSTLTLVAALDGHGVAWLPHAYAEPYLASGRLVELISNDQWSANVTRQYYLCWADSKNRQCFRTFRQWLVRQLPELRPKENKSGLASEQM